MAQGKSVGFGFRGSMVIFYQMLAYVTYVSFTSFPTNVFASTSQHGGSNNVTLMTLIGSVLSWVICYFILNVKIPKVRNLKPLLLIYGVVAGIFEALIIIIPEDQIVLWDICWVILNIGIAQWANTLSSLLIGYWFPRRKGTVMGFVTCAYPLTSGILLSVFLGTYFPMYYQALGMGEAYTGGNPLLLCEIPYFIVLVVALLVLIIFIGTYPEDVGAYRDNDKSFTPEMAQAMLKKELELKKNSCWKKSKIWGCKDYWCFTLPVSIQIAYSVAFMTLIMSLLQGFNDELSILAIPGFSLMAEGYQTVMIGLAVFAIAGSWLLGILDTRVGTKKAIFITCFFQIGACIGIVNTAWAIVISALCLGVFMGASSNYMISGLVRYWRHEDFAAVYTGAPPVGTAISASASYIISLLNTSFGPHIAFCYVGVLGIVGLILNINFKPEGIAAYDNKLRAEAGLEVNNELLERTEYGK